ncbi:hypothetical protein IPC1147_29180 [Pseudomonas aeruginosa]|uniref:TetR family transcriptional regulator n=1 Tax=Pseudomonas aeruginosa TaxID=287 RepID=UPI000FFE8D60|nr:TetR family transcriptional regulator [Pseudomonas aeruginosa]MBG4604162.1 TetR family transcriptional regulator [Pseudomonas aeruginosa]MBH8257453.1 TetR family transcriptional regulator [Pseudomonas aeruginosa]MCV3907760.1 TetR/AcrR family transcriptional regulator [Pseudomonas aeruginosa]NPS39668.1 TetR family transcriptional regulator [Pseudomonas aeruginosa]NPS89140.1 TetR family transcriptional regulator [Pseudomonas aeruginosa]
MRKTKVEVERTREKLLDAAELVFSSQGYAAAKLEDIAETAGLTRGAIYWHFSGKPDLLDAVVGRAWFPWDQLPIDRSQIDRVPTIPEMASVLGQGVQRTLFEPRLRRSALILLQGRELRSVSERVLPRLQGMQDRIDRHVAMVIEGSLAADPALGESSNQARVVGTFMFGAVSEALLLRRSSEQGAVGQEVERFVLNLLRHASAPS